MDFDIEDKNDDDNEKSDNQENDDDDEKNDNNEKIDDDNEEGTIDYTFEDTRFKRKVKRRLQSEIKYIKSNKKEDDRSINKFIIKTKNNSLRKFFIDKLIKHVANISVKFEQLIYDNAVFEYSNTITTLSFTEFLTNSFYNIYALLLQCYNYPIEKVSGKINKDKLKNILNNLLQKKINFTLDYFSDSKEKYLLEFKINTSEVEIEEGIYTCNKCGKNKTTRIQLQTRGADEPMTNFIRCINCGSKWKD